MEIEKTNNLENQKKKSDYKVSKELMENLENFWEESIDWGEGKKYPNRFAYDLIENGDWDIVLDHIENFNKTEQLATKLINSAYEDGEKWKIWKILSKFTWLSKILALSLISSKFLCASKVAAEIKSFKWLDYEVAKRLAMKGVLHQHFVSYERDEHDLSNNDFIWIDENQRQELIKLSKDRLDSNNKFKRSMM